jgi:hypothetical protein
VVLPLPKLAMRGLSAYRFAHSGPGLLLCCAPPIRRLPRRCGDEHAQDVLWHHALWTRSRVDIVLNTYRSPLPPILRINLCRRQLGAIKNTSTERLTKLGADVFLSRSESLANDFRKRALDGEAPSSAVSPTAALPRTRCRMLRPARRFTQTE